MISKEVKMGKKDLDLFGNVQIPNKMSALSCCLQCKLVLQQE